MIRNVCEASYHLSYSNYKHTFPHGLLSLFFCLEVNNAKKTLCDIFWKMENVVTVTKC